MSSMKRALVGSLAAVMMLGSLTACGGVKKSELSDDYSKVVAATYGNENIYLDEVNFILRDRQYMYEYYSAMYGMNLLNNEESVNVLYQEALSSILQTRVLCQHAADYNVELTEEEKALVADAVKSIVENDTMNNYYEIAGRDETMLNELMTKNAIANKVYFTIKEGAEITTTMDECTRNAVTYLLLSEVAEEAETMEEVVASEEVAE